MKGKTFAIFFLFLGFECFLFGFQGLSKKDLERLKPSEQMDLIPAKKLKGISLIAHIDWSPDGKSVAFDDGKDIFIYELKGDTLRRLTNSNEEKVVLSRRRRKVEVPVRYSFPRFSPDTKFIVCVRFLNEDSDLVIFSLPDGERFPLPNTKGGTEPAWTPEGRRLVFIKDRQIFIVNRDGSELNQLTDLVYASSPSCPRRLGRIAFISGLYNDLGIYQMSFNGSDIRLVRKIPGLISFSYSPDGNLIAYCAKKEWALVSLYVMDAEGNIVREISEVSNTNPGSPCWDETGRKIALPEEALNGGFKVVVFELRVKSLIFGKLIGILLIIGLAGAAGLATYWVLRFYSARRKPLAVPQPIDSTSLEEAEEEEALLGDETPTVKLSPRSSGSKGRGDITAETEIKAPGKVKGRVLSDFGEPLPEVRVDILDGVGDVIKEVRSTPDGSFSFDEVRPGTYTIAARASGYLSGSESKKILAISPGEEVSVELILEKPVFKVVGELYDTTNQFPLPDATIELIDESTKEVRTTKTGANGEFEFSDLKRGRNYILQASKEGYKRVFRSRAVFTPGASKIVSKQLELAPGYGVLRGAVLDDETKEGVGEVIVILKGRGDLSYEDATFTDNEGKFQFLKLPEGGFSLSFLKDGYTEETREVEVFAGMDKFIEVPFKRFGSAGGIVRGKVLTIRGTFISGATVKLVDREGKLVATTLSSEEGDYLIKGVSPGAYQLSAVKEGVGRRDEVILLKSGDEITLPLVLKERDVELFR